jgi:4-hydroxy-2-oxoheptanedioate aldolase
MQGNRLRRAWAEGRPVLNGWLGVPSSHSAEVMSHVGFDSLTVDLQHGAIDYSSALIMLTAISTTPVVPLARPTSLDPPQIMKLLDAGAWGIVCPMIDTPEDARRLVEACRYPPIGQRSFGPTRAAMSQGPGYTTDEANREIVVLGQIETPLSVANLDAILATEGLDGVYVGPSDLTLSMGLGANGDSMEPRFIETLRHVVARSRAAGRHVGMHCANGPQAKRMVEMGFDFVTVGSDTGLMTEAGRGRLALVRDAAPTASKGSGY